MQQLLAVGPQAVQPVVQNVAQRPPPPPVVLEFDATMSEFLSQMHPIKGGGVTGFARYREQFKYIGMVSSAAAVYKITHSQDELARVMGDTFTVHLFVDAVKAKFMDARQIKDHETILKRNERAKEQAEKAAEKAAEKTAKGAKKAQKRSRS